jgi:plasmid stability protein
MLWTKATRCRSQLDGKLACWYTGSMKTTLDLPDDLVRRMKIRAVQEGRPLKRLVAELLTQSLNVPAEQSPAASLRVSEPIELNARGFPVIRCGPNAGASRMTAEELIAMEQDTILQEDMERGGLTL